MKTNIILAVAAATALMAGCVKEPPKPADASFQILQADSTGKKIEVTSIMYGTYIDIVHTGPKADKVVFFTGVISKKWSKADNKGQAADQFGRLVNQKLIFNKQAGVDIHDTITCIATNIGNWGDDIEQDVIHKELILK